MTNKIFPTFQQFFRNDFPQTHSQTVRRDVYKNCLVCETSVRELIVFDVPLQQCRFPVDNLAEWNNGHPLGLRTVQAYVLVFDISNPETFLYCRKMREQILESFSHRDFKDKRIMVIGNKFDLIAEANPHTQELKDISTLVRKHWRCGYVECSAKFNYRVGEVFRELMGCSSTATGNANSNSGALYHRMGGSSAEASRRKGRCNIL